MTTTRRRGAALEAAILDAGWEQLTAEGYGGFTFEAVAARSQTGKAVLYRRWPDKESLLLAVLASKGFGTGGPIPGTGSLRGDVLAMLRSANNRLGDIAAALFSTVLGAYFDETKTNFSHLRSRLLGDRSPSMVGIIERAIDRHELDAVPPQRVMDLPFDLFRHELIMGLGPVPDEVIVDIVDTLFLPLVTGRPSAASSTARRIRG